MYFTLGYSLQQTYLDLSAQLRLFIPEDQNLGFRPEALLNKLGGGAVGELEFTRKHQCLVRSLAAFEKANILTIGAN